jgi:transcriptional regulator with XRE-family HTH domain
METLRRLRTKRGLSQARLAARAELDPSTVNQIERGAREASPTTLHKLAGALDVSLYELLEGEPSPKAPPPLPELGQPGVAYFVPLEEGEAQEVRFIYVRLLEENEPILQAMREASPEEAAKMRQQGEKSGWTRE